MNTKHTVMSAFFFAASFTLTNFTYSQPYPFKPIRLIVPFAPGGGSDNAARIVSDALSKRLNQSIVIDNKPGGGGTLAATYVVNSKPDGYTLLYATAGQQMINPHLMAKLPYDPVHGLIAVSQLLEATNVLVVNKDLPVASVEELISLAKSRPGQINFASSGIGGTSHLAGELFKSMAGIDIVHVPYKGSGLAMTDLIGGAVQMTIDNISVYLPHMKSGAVRLLAVATLDRSPSLPETPPIAKTLPGFDASPINYISVPAGTPRPIIDRLNKEVNAVLHMPEIQSRFLAMGSTLKGGSPEQMEAVIRADSAKWKKVIELSGAKPE